MFLHIYIIYAHFNIFDVKYSDYGGLELPGINFQVGVRVKL